MKLALLYVATGKYIAFWKEFYESFEQNFCTNSEKDYYIFTDSLDFDYKNNDNVFVIEQESLGWPDNTLKRYHMFSRIISKLEKYDYIFFLNANCKCMSVITEEEFINDKDLIFVQHPGYFNKSNEAFPYERNEKSKAYIPYGDGEKYNCGGDNGGKSASFIKLILSLRDETDLDLEQGIVAKWHEESHINHYLYNLKDSNNIAILSPAYCFPEDTHIPFECKILIREKSKYIDVDNIKNIPLINRINKRLRKFLKSLINK